MGAVQPFISGAISKTVNMPEEATVDEVEALHLLSWQLGLKAVAIYRDNCKVGQPLSTAKKDDAGRVRRRPRSPPADRRADRRADRPRARSARSCPAPATSQDVRVPGGRLQGLRHDRRVRRRSARRDLPHRVEAGLDAGRHHGRLRQVDLLRPAVRRAAAGLRRGVHEHALRAGRHDRRPGHPLRHRRSWTTCSAGWRSSTSRYEERAELGIFSIDERLQPTLPGVEESVDRDGRRASRWPPIRRPSRRPASWPPSSTWGSTGSGHQPEAPALAASDAPLCMQCGVQMQRAGIVLRLPELRQHQRLQLTLPPPAPAALGHFSGPGAGEVTQRWLVQPFGVAPDGDRGEHQHQAGAPQQRPRDVVARAVAEHRLRRRAERQRADGVDHRGDRLVVGEGLHPARHRRHRHVGARHERQREHQQRQALGRLRVAGDEAEDDEHPAEGEAEDEAEPERRRGRRRCSPWMPEADGEPDGGR